MPCPHPCPFDRVVHTKTSTVGRDQLYRREIGAVAADVAGQQRHTTHGGMGANEEIRQHASAPSARFAVLRKDLAPQKQGVARDRDEFQGRLFDEGIQILDAVVANRKLCVDNIV